MSRIKAYLAAVSLGLVLVMGAMPLTVHAASLSPSTQGTVIADQDVPLDGGAQDVTGTEDTAGGEVDIVTVDDGDVPLSNVIMGSGCSFWFHLLLLLGGAVVGAVGMKTVDVVGGKKDEEKNGGQKR